MRFQSGSTSQRGAQQGGQGQMNQGGGGEQKQWPFKAFEYPPETGQPEFTLESLKEVQAKPRRPKQTQQGG